MQPQNLTISVLLAMLSVVLLGCTIRAPDPSREFTSEEIARRLLGSTVYIKTLRKTASNAYQMNYGSGFVIKHGYVATNYHVIRDSNHITLRLVNSERELPIDRIIHTDGRYDLAILQCSRLKAVPLNLGNSDKIQIGETVYVTGNPKGWFGTFSVGVVSAIRDNPFKANDDMIQITAPVSPGSSGGPVMNRNGLVIAVIRSQSSTGQNINFAAPVNILRLMMQESIVNP